MPFVISAGQPFFAQAQEIGYVVHFAPLPIDPVGIQSVSFTLPFSSTRIVVAFLQDILLLLPPVVVFDSMKGITAGLMYSGSNIEWPVHRYYKD